MNEQVPIRTRSWLFTPATRPERFAKAAETGADVLLIDLEDAVAPCDKAAARTTALDYLAGLRAGTLRALRINGLDTRAGIADLDALLGSAASPDFLVLPKTETAGHLQILDRLQRQRGHPPCPDRCDQCGAHPQCRGSGEGARRDWCERQGRRHRRRGDDRRGRHPQGAPHARRCRGRGMNRQLGSQPNLTERTISQANKETIQWNPCCPPTKPSANGATAKHPGSTMRTSSPATCSSIDPAAPSSMSTTPISRC